MITHKSALRVFTRLKKASLHFSNKNKSKLDSLLQQNTQSEAKKTVFTPKESRILTNNEFQVFQGKSKMNSRLFTSACFVMTPINFFLVYKLIFALKAVKILKTLLWGAPSFIGLKMQIVFMRNFKFVVRNIFLDSSGETVRIESYSSPISTRIENIRRIKEEEAVLLYSMVPDLNLRFIPFVVENQVYLLPKTCIYCDSELFSAISEGRNIEMSTFI